MIDLKCVYKVVMLNVVEIVLDELEVKWGDKYLMVINFWCSKWFILLIYFKYLDYVQKVIYIINVVKVVYCQFCKFIKIKGGFVNENSLLKLFYVGIFKVIE